VTSPLRCQACAWLRVPPAGDEISDNFSGPALTHCARCNGRSVCWKDVLASSDSKARPQTLYSKEQFIFFNFDIF